MLVPCPLPLTLGPKPRASCSITLVPHHPCTSPFRAETTRILLHYGGIPFEDFVFQREQWAELKTKMPFGQVPVLEVSHAPRG